MIQSPLHVLRGDTDPTKFWSIWICLLASVGMYMRRDDPQGDIHLLISIAPWWAWMLLLAYIGVSRVVGLFWWRGNLFTKVATPLVCIVVWSLFFAAGVTAPNFGLGLLFLVPAFQEAWLLGRVVFEERYAA